MILQGKLYEYLCKIDCEAHNMLNSLITKLVEQQGITEELKTENQLKWVGMMNNVKAQAEEIVYSEIVYNWKAFNCVKCKFYYDIAFDNNCYIWDHTRQNNYLYRFTQRMS